MTSTLSRLCLLVATSSLIACGGTEQDGDEVGSMDSDLRAATTTTSRTGKTSTPVAAPTFSLATTDVRGTAFKTSYLINDTMNLFIATDINGQLPGHHVASVYLVMPSGSLYQRIDVKFATDVVAAVGEQQAEKTSTGWRIWANVPVAGTVIQQSRLVGTWTSEAWVDAANTASAVTTFNLN